MPSEKSKRRFNLKFVIIAVGFALSAAGGWVMKSATNPGQAAVGVGLEIAGDAIQEAGKHMPPAPVPPAIPAPSPEPEAAEDSAVVTAPL